MGLKICEKCGEEVDEAKAFCPDCGNPFVEEKKREEASEFDKYAGTVNFSQSVFGLMLAEMDLDTSKPPQKENPKPKKEFQSNIDSKPVQPVEVAQPEPQKPERIPVEVKKTGTEPRNEIRSSGINKWVIIGIVGGLFFIFLSILVLAVFLYFYALKQN